MTDFSLTIKSANDKTGPMPVSMSHMDTCPPSCALRGACYAKGRMMVNWLKLTDGNLRSGEPFSDFLRSVKALPATVKVWRHNQAGDLPGAHNRLNRRQCTALAAANSAGGYNRGGFTFTHYPVIGDAATARTLAHNREVIAAVNRAGFAVNLSADTVDQVDPMLALGIAPVTVLLPRDATKGLRTAGGARVTVCPAARSNHGVNCLDCKLCQRIGRKVVIGFPAHGARIRMADTVARGGVL